MIQMDASHATARQADPATAPATALPANANAKRTWTAALVISPSTAIIVPHWIILFMRLKMPKNSTQ